MRNAYVTKREAPKSYVAVTKPLAKALYEQGKMVTLCGSNVNSFHVFNGWCLGVTLRGPEACCFDTIVNSFQANLEPELGRYAVFYTKKENVV